MDVPEMELGLVLGPGHLVPALLGEGQSAIARHQPQGAAGEVAHEDVDQADHRQVGLDQRGQGLLHGADLDLGHRYQHWLMNGLGQGGGSVAGADVEYLLEGVLLDRGQYVMGGVHFYRLVI